MNCNCHRTGTDSMNGVGKWASWLRCPGPPGLPGHQLQCVMCNQTPPGPRGQNNRTRPAFTIKYGSVTLQVFTSAYAVSTTIVGLCREMSDSEPLLNNCGVVTGTIMLRRRAKHSTWHLYSSYIQWATASGTRRGRKIRVRGSFASNGFLVRRLTPPRMGTEDALLVNFIL
jgi:hypothetical protein